MAKSLRRPQLGTPSRAGFGSYLRTSSVGRPRPHRRIGMETDVILLDPQRPSHTRRGQLRHLSSLGLRSSHRAKDLSRASSCPCSYVNRLLAVSSAVFVVLVILRCGGLSASSELPLIAFDSLQSLPSADLRMSTGSNLSVNSGNEAWADQTEDDTADWQGAN